MLRMVLNNKKQFVKNVNLHTKVSCNFHAIFFLDKRCQKFENKIMKFDKQFMPTELEKNIYIYTLYINI